jgi:lipopolysaccharide transport system permease protein
MVTVFVLIFGRAANISGGGAPYAAFAVTSLVGWGFLSTVVSLGANALVSDAPLIRKVYFPREAPVVGSVVATIPDLLVGVLLILVAVPVTGATLGWSVAVAPLMIVLLVIPALAITLPLAALSVYYRDFRYVVPFGVQLWLFASPVAYPATAVPEHWRILYAILNPAVGPLDALRHVFALGVAPDWTLVGWSAASGALLLVVGYRFFKRLEREFADVV